MTAAALQQAATKATQPRSQPNPRQNLSPRAWIWYWYGAILHAVAVGTVGIATGDPRLIFVGIAMIVVAVGLIAW